MKKIKKAVIPVAGFGTRFLPFTKAMPKEMLPIVDTPTIQYIVEEAVNAGIEDILFVTASHSNKRAIEDHFDQNKELEHLLIEKEKFDFLKIVQSISSMANIHYIRQKEAKGLGDAILCAKSFIGDDDFAVLLGDDIVLSDTPAIGQLIEAHSKTQKSIIGVQSVELKEVHKYGIISQVDDKKLSKMNDIVEKPNMKDAPSNKAVLGRYILTSKIFDFLEKQEIGAGSEVQLTDSIKSLISKEDVFAYSFEGTRYDVGDKLGFLKATVDVALSREDLHDDFFKFLKSKK